MKPDIAAVDISSIYLNLGFINFWIWTNFVKDILYVIEGS